MIHHIYSILYLLPQNYQVRHTAQLYISVDCAKKLFSIGNNWLLSPSLAMLKHALSSYFEMDWCGYQWSYTHCFYLLYIPVSTYCFYLMFIPDLIHLYYCFIFYMPLWPPCGWIIDVVCLCCLSVCSHINNWMYVFSTLLLCSDCNKCRDLPKRENVHFEGLILINTSAYKWDLKTKADRCLW